MGLAPAPTAWARLLERVQLGCVVLFAAVLPLGKSPAEIALGVGVAVWVARTVLGARRTVIPENPLTVWLLAWFLIGLVSISNSVDIGASLHGLRKLIKHFAWYLVIIDAIRSTRALRLVAWGLVVGLGLLVLDSGWQAVFGRDLFYGNPVATKFGGALARLQGPFDHPASFAIHLVSVVPMLIAWTLPGTTRRRRAGLILAGGGLLALVFSWNRGGFVGMLAALAVLACGLRRWTPILLAAGLAAVQAVFLPREVSEWAASMPSLLHQFTEPDRLAIWQTTVEMIGAHPLLGVGINSFVQAYPAYAAAGAQFGELGPYAHNLYLHLTAELGIAGLLVFLGVLWRLALASARWFRGGTLRTDAALGLGCAAGLAGYLVVGLVESSLYYGRGSLTFWLLAGLLVAGERLSREGAPAPAG